MEPFGNIVQPLVAQMSSEEEKYFNIPTERNVGDLKKILENKYSDILKINFNIEGSNQKFWFISKNKNPNSAVRLDPKICRNLGIGNSTGLGMAPFIVNHPTCLLYTSPSPRD